MSTLLRNEIKQHLEGGSGGGASPPEAEENFKKSNKMEAFPLFFAFWQGSLDPPNYELAP